MRNRCRPPPPLRQPPTRTSVPTTMMPPPPASLPRSRWTYLCVDRGVRKLLACKSFPKRKLRTAVDVQDVRRQVAIMRHLPRHVSHREACEDEHAVCVVMEPFDRIVALGHCTKRAAASVTRAASTA